MDHPPANALKRMELPVLGGTNGQNLKGPNMDGTDATGPFPVALEGKQFCPVRHVLDRLGDAWSFLVVLNLGNTPMRFNALKRQIDGISQRMLTLTLRKLERDGLVSRHVQPTTPPQVEYRLTPMGMSLGVPLVGLMDWATEHQAAIDASRQAYDAAQTK